MLAEITPEMLVAGAAVLWNDDRLNLSPAVCEHLAREILEAAFREHEKKLGLAIERGD